MSRPARRKVGRPPAADSAATRGRILEAARRTFAEQGYAGASNQAVAKRAGVTATALYHWFDRKADLFAAVYSQALDLLLDAYVAVAARESSCIEKLCAVFEANIALNRAHPGLTEFLATSALDIERDGELASGVGQQGAEVEGFFRGLLEEGQASGEIPSGLAIEPTVRLLMATSFGLAWFRARVPTPEDHDAMLRALQALLRGELWSPPGEG